MALPRTYRLSILSAFNILLTALSVGSTPAFAQQSPGMASAAGHYLFTDTESICLFQPQRVADDVLEMKWSADSNQLLALSSREKPPVLQDRIEEADLTATRYDRRTHALTQFWKRRFASHVMLRSELQWLPTTKTAVVQIAWVEATQITTPDGKVQTTPSAHEELLWIDMGRGVVKELPSDQFTQMFVSPTRPTVVLIHQSFGQQQITTTLTALQPDGVPGDPFTLNNPQATFGGWSADGHLLNMQVFEQQPDKKVKTSWLQFNPVSGTTELLSKQPPPYVPIPPRPALFVLKSTPQIVKELETTASILPLWVETTGKSELPRMLVCADAYQGMLAPDGSAVAYCSQGSGWVSDFIHFPLAAFKAMQAQARRVVLINHAKQLGLSAIMWAEDHDETLPGPGNIETELKPYLGTDSLFDGFNYTYDGGPLGDIESPAETELGYVNGPDGRAVIYADGHVKWKDH